jgi:hypothetical protein
MNTQCSVDGQPGVMCWATCYAVSDLPCNLDAQCVNLGTGEINDGQSMMPCHDEYGCELECVDTPTNTTFNYDGYCYGTGNSRQAIV